MNIKKDDVIDRLIGKLISAVFANDSCRIFHTYDPNTGKLNVKSYVSISDMSLGNYKEDALLHAKLSLVSLLDMLTKECNSINDPRIKEFPLSDMAQCFFPSDTYCAELTVYLND